jgi:hypothetical protein
MHIYAFFHGRSLTVISIISVDFIFSNKYAKADSISWPFCMVWSVAGYCWIGDVL